MSNPVVHQIAMEHDLPVNLVLEVLETTGSNASNPSDEVTLEGYKQLLVHLGLGPSPALLSFQSQKSDSDSSSVRREKAGDFGGILTDLWTRASFGAIHDYLSEGTHSRFHLASNGELAKHGFNANILHSNWRAALNLDSEVIVFCTLLTHDEQQCIVELLDCSVTSNEAFARSSAKVQVIGLTDAELPQLEKWLTQTASIFLLKTKTRITVERIQSPSLETHDSIDIESMSQDKLIIKQPKAHDRATKKLAETSATRRTRFGGPGHGPWWYSVCPKCSAHASTAKGRIESHLAPNSHERCELSGVPAQEKEPEHVAVHGICPGYSQTVAYSAKSGAIHEHLLQSEPTTKCLWTRRQMAQIERKASPLRILQDFPKPSAPKTPAPRMYFDQTKSSVRAYNAGSPGSSRRS